MIFRQTVRVAGGGNNAVAVKHPSSEDEIWRRGACKLLWPRAFVSGEEPLREESNHQFASMGNEQKLRAPLTLLRIRSTNRRQLSTVKALMGKNNEWKSLV